MWFISVFYYLSVFVEKIKVLFFVVNNEGIIYLVLSRCYLDNSSVNFYLRKDKYNENFAVDCLCLGVDFEGGLSGAYVTYSIYVIVVMRVV